MVKKVFKYIGLTLLGVILILSFTNPNLKLFKEFLGNNNNVSRESNYLIFSIYKETIPTTQHSWGNHIYYLGVALNFYKIDEKTNYERSTDEIN